MTVTSLPESTIPVAIRKAAPEDVPSILAIERATNAAAHWTAEQYQGRVQAGYCWVAELALAGELGGEICGFLCAHVVADEWEIENIAVVETRRHRSIGGKLMEALIGEWKQCAGAVLLLEVRESNVAARALYAKYGLREVSRRPRYYDHPPEDAVLYRREGSDRTVVPLAGV
jgi:ribosomal-protein-alanine N-acetyltransferase